MSHRDGLLGNPSYCLHRGWAKIKKIFAFAQCERVFATNLVRLRRTNFFASTLLPPMLRIIRIIRTNIRLKQAIYFIYLSRYK